MDNSYLAIFLGLILISGISSIQYASGVSADMNGPDSPPVFFLEDSGAVTIVDTVELVPGAGPWIKHIEYIPTLTPIIEILTVGGSTPWCDWHESIDIPPTDGAAVYTMGGFDIDGGVATPIPGIAGTTSFDLVFSPCIMPGSTLTIKKAIESPSGITSTGHPGVAFLQIRQYPTGGGTAVGGEFIPIDATAVLIAGAQTNALSVLGAFAVIGAIAFVTLVISVKRKRN